MKEERHQHAFELQAELAAAKEDALKLRAERQQRFRDDLSQLNPLQRLERAVWIMGHEQTHDAFGTMPPLSSADVARVQQDAVEHVRETAMPNS